MGQGVNFAINTAQAGQYQIAAAQAGGFANGRDVDVNFLTRLGKAWQFGSDHDSRRVFKIDLAGVGRRVEVRQRSFQTHAQTAQHGLHALRREGHIGTVARALQADHQAITDQLVGAHGSHAG